MTNAWQFSGRATFSARDAWCLIHEHKARPVAERELRRVYVLSRQAYRLTPLGLIVRDLVEEASEGSSSALSIST
jgi:hypothetical protein